MNTKSSRERGSERALKRSLGLFDATTIVAGSMIGSGIFLVSAPMMRDLGSAGWLLVSWILTAALTVTAALSYGELTAMMPQAGGQYVYLREAFSPLLGFLYGWTLFLIIQTGIIAAVAIGFARYIGLLMPNISETTYLVPPIHLLGSYAVSLSSVQLIAIFIIGVLTLFNAAGLHYGKVLQNIFTISKVAALVAVTVLGLIYGLRHPDALLLNFAHSWSPRADALLSSGLRPGTRQPLLVALCLAQVGSLFAADGWNNVTFIAGEVIDPARNAVRALTFGTLLVMVLYFFANLAYVFVLPLPQIAHAPADRVAAVMLQTIYPKVGSEIIAGIIVIAAVGCINGMVLSGARAYYAMAKDGLFFPPAARLNRSRVPANALWLQGAWAIALVLVRIKDRNTNVYGNLYSNLLDYVIGAALLFYMATITAVLRLRHKHPTADRPYCVPGYPFLPLFYIAVAAVIVTVLCFYRPAATGPSFIIVLVGIPCYYVFKNYRDKIVHPRSPSVGNGGSSPSCNGGTSSTNTART